MPFVASTAAVAIGLASAIRGHGRCGCSTARAVACAELDQARVRAPHSGHVGASAVPVYPRERGRARGIDDSPRAAANGYFWKGEDLDELFEMIRSYSPTPPVHDSWALCVLNGTSLFRRRPESRK